MFPALAPGVINELEDQVRALCQKHLEPPVHEEYFDAGTQYAQTISPEVITRVLGFPERDEDLFRDFVHLVLDLIDLDLEPEVRAPMFTPLNEYFTAQIEDHLARPRDDAEFLGYVNDGAMSVNNQCGRASTELLRVTTSRSRGTL